MVNLSAQVILANPITTQIKSVSLPYEEDDVENALREIGIERGEEDDDFDEWISRLFNNGEFAILKVVASTYDISGDLFEINDTVQRIEDLHDYEEEELQALVCNGEAIDKALDMVEDGDVIWYPGTDLVTLAERLGDEDVFSKEYLLEHIDWEAIARDLEIDGYTEVNGGVLVS